ncbi:hypothetical protein RRG08_027657 [Elysia crispata]|uniref:Decapping nuclease n=1 Tax=Elysia crispata TaxID=231223 RepID=A0AAE0XME4_9GAST|nr:hypothetical protein RRG08_027657 [Elysia crispata]
MQNRHVFYLKQASSNVSANSQKLDTRNSASCFNSLNTDFFCWRGLLTHLACLPYENRDDLLVAVIKFRGSYFMCEFETEAKKIERETETPRQKEMSAWGFKFEQYVTSDKPHDFPNINQPVNTNEEFGSVARSRLGVHSLVYGAEVDCVDPNSQHSNQYVELKTSRIIQAQRQYENFCKFKLIKWWAQSFLIGISRVVCGFRDDDGIVHKLQDYPVMDMPAVAQSVLQNPWKPAVCFNFLDNFLNFVKSVITEDDPRCVHLFRWQPGSKVVCEQLGEDPEFLFLPDWFINWEAWDQPCTV